MDDDSPKVLKQASSTRDETMSTQTNFDLVLFGATGDLAMRKLLPCLYQAHVAGLLHPEGRILGVSRSELDTAGFWPKWKRILKSMSNKTSQMKRGHRLSNVLSI